MDDGTPPEAQNSIGEVTAVRGPVIDVAFPGGALSTVNDALHVRGTGRVS